MPQEFQVLRCCTCETFQVHIIKKANKKWACKLCGEKQSTIKIYGTGSAKDCRIHVQKLNLARGQQEENVLSDEALEDATSRSPPAKKRNWDEGFEHQAMGLNSDMSSIPQFQATPVNEQRGVSKWSSYLNNEEEEKELAETYPQLNNTKLNFDYEEAEEEEKVPPVAWGPQPSRQNKLPAAQGKWKMRKPSKSLLDNDLGVEEDSTYRPATWKASMNTDFNRGTHKRESEECNEFRTSKKYQDGNPSCSIITQPPKLPVASKWSSYEDTEEENDQGKPSPFCSTLQPSEDSKCAKSTHQEPKIPSKSATSAGKSSNKWAAFLDDEEEGNDVFDWNL